MSILQDQTWRLKYTPDHGDLVKSLYIPALSSAVRYDRLTGYFRASALALAARGVERLVARGGRMRMVVGCTLAPPEIAAIENGESIRAQVEKNLIAHPLAPPDFEAAQALELVAWMVTERFLEIKVAVPCNSSRRPIPADGIFHEKSGIIEDKTGDRIAFNGSLNETEAGWTRNWESLNVFTSWRDKDRVNEEDENFARIWADKAKHVITLDVPTAVQADLMRFMPDSDGPARMKKTEAEAQEPASSIMIGHPEVGPTPVPADELRKRVWAFVAAAPNHPNGGDRVGEATAAIAPWPHQVRAFHRMYDNWPPKLLIADEVGLGKTIQAGLLLRQAWLAGKAKRILIMAPKNVCRQWQIELREKFNLNWPIYDGQKLNWYPSPVMRGQHERSVGRDVWHKEPIVIASSHLLRRGDRQRELLEAAEPWDLIVLDEAHHARRRGAGTAAESGPNALLRLMRRLVDRTQGLVLLTATPMQVHPVEIYDLLALLGLPPEWTEQGFLQFFNQLVDDSPSHEAFDRLAAMFRSIENAYGKVHTEDLEKDGVTSSLRGKRILAALRDEASIPRRQLETADRKAALSLMRRHTPVQRLISRHTRELLRKYFKAGKLSTPIADRVVEDQFIHLSLAERAVYDGVEDYISSTYNQASMQERNAVGFVMTIYRRRLASSFFALGQTLQGHLDAVEGTSRPGQQVELFDDLDDDERADRDADDVEKLEQEALAIEEAGDIKALLDQIRSLPVDTKLTALRSAIEELQAEGYQQVMVFTQFTDTMDFIRDQLFKTGGHKLMCFSGRGGEVPGADNSWRTISRDDAKKRFRDKQADILLCTDAAAEGLNFQFCGSLINYDMPWNPMRVEQRIGRIDRLGQKFPEIRIINLHYADTVEADIYCALRERIGLFETVVGRLQPILARLPSILSDSVLNGRTKPKEQREAIVSGVEAEANQFEQTGFDLDAVTDPELLEPERIAPPMTLDDLEGVITRSELLPAGIEASALGRREYRFRQPGMGRDVRVTTDPSYYDQNADSVELWSPGNPAFPDVNAMLNSNLTSDVLTLAQLLQTKREP
ncbi:SNF2-related protein [Hyphomicrobium sp.]|uniref:SNF2-related protein n=1 Tax=Hyphomicrobium sp. TaxID=82 RepID=UPI002E31FE8C|nr:SNF2-related protein [Hyphomicrobium sp.]HEX2839934.1 SNF2-related protein [Hyphomicrobium sp.]